MSKYLMSVIGLVIAALGWWLWHHKDADFMNAWCGSMAFFLGLFIAVFVLITGPDYIPFN